ncbi:MAG: fibronectin type III domain-containing protein [bacterium]|nr:fibronectin type III domain-containing protein [bacterium]
MLGTNSLATVAGPGCSLAEDTALRVGTTRHYTLSATRSGPGQATCTVTADTASHTVTITFTAITIEGLAATGSGDVGSTYQDPFSVLGTNSLATVAGPGCSLAEDTALRVGTTRHYTLSAVATEAGEVICRITARTTTQTATITFTALPNPTPDPDEEEEDEEEEDDEEEEEEEEDDDEEEEEAESAPTPAPAVTVDSSLGVPSLVWLDCPDRDDATKMKVNWLGVSGAAGYQAEEDGGDLPGWSGTQTWFRSSWSPGESYRWRVRSTGPNNTVSKKWSVWAGVTCPGPPPAPTGVTASCQNGEVSASWKPAGTLKSRATSYEPRIFTGGSSTPDTRWTTDTAGHNSTSATIPASGEPDLPDSGVFQVKVKATNTAGDSPWSAAVDVTCGKPGPVTGLKCTAAGDDSVTVEWDGAVSAKSFEVQSTGIISVGLSDVFWEAGGQPSGGHPSVRKYAHTFDTPARGHLYLFGVRGVNSKGHGPESTVKCRPRLSDMLDVDCTANALLVARFSDPFEGTGLAPTQYIAAISKAGSTQPTTTRTQAAILVHTDAEYGAQYTVSLTATHGTGWVRYTETETETCPVHTDNWNSPNFYDPDEDCNDDTPLVGWIKNAYCRVGESKLQIAESYQEMLGLKPALIDVDPVLLSRTCDTTVPNRRTCRETWSENIILLKNPGIDWKAIDLTDWSGPGEITGNLATIIGTGMTVAGFATGTWYTIVAGVAVLGLGTTSKVFAYMEDAAGKQYIRMYPTKAAAVKDAAGTSLNIAGIANFQGCLSEYDLSPQMDPITVTKIYGTFTDERTSTYHYCLPEDDQN